MFLYRLAAHLGIADVEEFANTVPMPVIRRWLAYYRLEPFGDEWRRTGKLATVVAASAGVKVQESFEDMFLPTYDPTRPQQTEAQMMAELAKLRVPGVQLPKGGD